MAILKDKESLAAQRLRQHSTDDIFISVIVAHELFYGAFKSQHPDRNVALIDGLFFPVLEFAQEDAREAGKIRAWLAAQGTPIGPYDVLIAGQSIARNLTLVTHNTAEFSRVPGLAYEDWEKTP